MKLNRRGLIATILYHALLLALLVFAGLTFPDPPPEEEGILVNFGTDEFGLGDFEPMGDDQQAGDPELEVTQQQEPVEEVEEYVEPVQETRESTPPPEPVEVDQTQDLEETRVREEQRQAELERQRLEQERIERERREEQARLEQERIERERREEEERKERERQEQAERLNNLGRDAFGRQGVGENEGGEGITEGDGNQGNPNGSPDSDNYSTGGGLGNNPFSYGLGSRKARGTWPLPNMSNCNVNQRIVIRVQIQVDQEGNVTNALVERSTVSDNCIYEMVVKAAKESKFSADQTAAFRQTGYIEYTILPREHP